VSVEVQAADSRFSAVAMASPQVTTRRMAALPTARASESEAQISTAGIADPTWTPASRGWYASLLAGTVPLFALGMVASALADRLVFAGWATVAGTGYALLLRAAWVRGWSAAARTALVLAWAALALLTFATLVARHGEVLDLGYRAVLWPIYSPALATPLTARAAAAVLALAAIGSLVLARTRRTGEAP
jgi:hypothetical protein